MTPLAIIAGMRLLIPVVLTGILAAADLPYPIVGTGQTACYDDRREIPAPGPDSPWFGQDAQHPGPAPSYRDNGDGTVSDLVTGLMWVKARGEKLTWEQARAGAAACRVGGHADWRLPDIKTLYSLIDFRGGSGRSEAESRPYLDARAFGFTYGKPPQERLIDCQDWSATAYVATTMHGDATVFGVNFADGRIKGYPVHRRREGVDNRLYARYVRGNPAYGRNDLADNRDGTITDRATGLMWCRDAAEQAMDWPAALAWVRARNAAGHLGHRDWRLPSAKELQSIVDYARPLAGGRGPALDPLFHLAALPDGEFPWLWSATTHLEGPPGQAGTAAVYIAFGRALGWMAIPPGSPPALVDVHGAGAQRSDPKTGDPSAFPHGRGPQGDVVRIRNAVRLVRSLP